MTGAFDGGTGELASDLFPVKPYRGRPLTWRSRWPRSAELQCHASTEQHLPQGVPLPFQLPVVVQTFLASQDQQFGKGFDACFAESSAPDAYIVRGVTANAWNKVERTARVSKRRRAATHSLGPEGHDDWTVVAVALPFVGRDLDDLLEPPSESL